MGNIYKLLYILLPSSSSRNTDPFYVLAFSLLFFNILLSIFSLIENTRRGEARHFIVKNLKFTERLLKDLRY